MPNGDTSNFASSQPEESGKMFASLNSEGVVTMHGASQPVRRHDQSASEVSLEEHLDDNEVDDNDMEEQSAHQGKNSLVRVDTTTQSKTEESNRSSLESAQHLVSSTPYAAVISLVDWRRIDSRLKDVPVATVLVSVVLAFIGGVALTLCFL